MRPIPKIVNDNIHRSLHTQPDHPLCIVKGMIYEEFKGFAKFDGLNPIVTTEQNFDSLLIPHDHVARSDSDTFYLDGDDPNRHPWVRCTGEERHLLRTHTSAHQAELLGNGYDRFLVTGEVFRRDEVDARHYPIFHQMEGVKVADNTIPSLFKTLDGIIKKLFPAVEFRVVPSSFPFTYPSWEYEIFWGDRWIEVLGCGIVRKEIMNNAHRDWQSAWAFGLGLERLAMILFDIPDIRLFWSKDKRFLNQFKAGTITKFEPFSNQPPCIKDIAFWLSDDFEPNDFYALVRDVAGDLIEEVVLIDSYDKDNGKKTSHCYRLVFRSHEQTLVNEEINAIMSLIRDKTTTELGVKIR